MLENRIEVEFKKLTDAELRGDANEVKQHRSNYEFYKAELEALNMSLKGSIKTGGL